LPLAARTQDFAAALGGYGLEVSPAPGLMEILGAFTDAVDGRLRNNCGRTDLGEMAQMAAVETYAEVISPRTDGLFGTAAEEVRQAFAAFATTHHVGRLSRRFFSRLIFKLLDYYLSRTLTDHVGEGQRFSCLKQVADFYTALETHCAEATGVVEIFSGEWFSKQQWETRGNITPRLVARFAHGAGQKLIEVLKRGNQHDA
jgi:hypothetical protein